VSFANRWLGLVDDPRSGGSDADWVVAHGFTAPNEYLPVTTADVNQGRAPSNRNNEVIGKRGNRAPKSFSADPRLTFECRAYPVHFKHLLRAAVSGTVTPTGTAPASITSAFRPVAADPLKTLQVWVVRESQIDRLSGCFVNTLTLNLSAAEEGTLTAELWPLYHQLGDLLGGASGLGATLLTPSYAAAIDTLKLRDTVAYLKDGTVQVLNLSNLSITFDNGLIDDFESRFFAGKNVAVIVDSGTGSPVSYRVWYPTKNKIGPQAITGTMGFGDVRPDQDLLALLSQSQKVIVEASGGPAGTTPPAKEMFRFTFDDVQWSGGDGAGPLVREGDIRSTYDFTAYVSGTTGNDLLCEYVGAAALT
jgi:Phage tail tube protein